MEENRKEHYLGKFEELMIFGLEKILNSTKIHKTRGGPMADETIEEEVRLISEHSAELILEIIRKNKKVLLKTYIQIQTERKNKDLKNKIAEKERELGVLEKELINSREQ